MPSITPTHPGLYTQPTHPPTRNHSSGHANEEYCIFGYEGKNSLKFLAKGEGFLNAAKEAGHFPGKRACGVCVGGREGGG